MPILLDRKPLADTDAARAVAHLLAGTAPITRRDLNTAMTEAMAGSDADGTWSQRDSFEMLENALALHLATRPYPLAGLADVTHASALMDRLPTQTVRSETQVELQQFSTPVDIAAIAVLMAAIGPDDIVLEPSAGNGLLVVQAPPCASLQLNELDATRRARLATFFPEATITGHDGAGLISTHAALPRPTVVLMNPPFARSVGRGADDLAALRHLQAAIRRVAKGGRVVALMPDWFTPSARMRAAYEAVLAGCTVRASLRLEHCYRKHGTDVAVRLYVIDKTPGGIMPSTIQRAAVLDFLDVVELPPRAALVGETTIPAAVPKGRLSLFGAARTTRVTAPRPYHAPVRNDVLPVGYPYGAEPGSAARHSFRSDGATGARLFVATAEQARAARCLASIVSASRSVGCWSRFTCSPECSTSSRRTRSCRSSRTGCRSPDRSCWGRGCARSPVLSG